MNLFDTLILSGCSTKGFFLLGILYKHKEEINNISRYIGTSAGALISTMLCMGFSIEEIFTIAHKVQKVLPKSGKEWTYSVINLYKNNGLLTINPYITEIEKEIKKKYGFIPTLQQLYDITEKELIIITSCLNTFNCVQLSYKTYPNLSIISALDMTSRIPLLFTPYKYKDYLYVDGGITDQFPIDLFNPKEKTLAIYIRSIDFDNNCDIITYISQILFLATDHKYNNISSHENLTFYEIKSNFYNIKASLIESIIMFIYGFSIHKK